MYARSEATDARSISTWPWSFCGDDTICPRSCWTSWRAARVWKLKSSMRALMRAISSLQTAISARRFVCCVLSSWSLLPRASFSSTRAARSGSSYERLSSIAASWSATCPHSETTR
eukprot:Amastigsp_a686556_5.p4 type:complete len:116 gc:universal Amastigsp_a686556_5:576-923(+)